MADIIWARVQVVLTDVPIEYMDCNSGAFADGDEVLIEFTNQDWDQPKIIGFKERPTPCVGIHIFPGQNAFGSGWFEEASRTFKLAYNSESWAWKNPFPRDYSYSGEDQFARVSYAATGEEGIGFTVGGRTTSDTEEVKYFFDHLDIYDSVAESFSIGEDYPEEIFDLTFDSLKNGICIAHGGRNYWSHTGQSRTRRYTISSDTWNWPASGEQVYNHASFVINSVVYVVGGNSGNANGAIVYRGADNFGFNNPDWFFSNINVYVPNQHMTAYDDNEQAWTQKSTCPVANYVQVKGWNLEGKGLVGGGAYTYEYDADIQPGYERFYLYTGGPFEGQWWPWPKEPWYPSCIWGCDYLADGYRHQVHWVHRDIGLKRDGSTHLYDNLTDSWTTKGENVFSAVGNQATSTAQDETSALSFSLQTPGLTDQWYEYKLSTDVWSNRGEFRLYTNEEEGLRFNRLDAAGAEL